MTACAACGTELPQNAKFCFECGSSVAAPAPAEYKQVTVLFADVVHSMDIAAAVGAERLREIMTDLFTVCAAVVQRYGGRVEKFIGDAVMAVWGAPVALEDHAFRACLAAVDIQQEARGLADEVHRQDGIALQLRVGLNSGRVVAGELGSNPSSYTAIGEQVGLAQRMESVASPGGVVLSEATARLVEDQVMLAEPELVHIKGVVEPVPVRRLLAASVDRQHASRQDPVLVGRGWEMGALTGLLDEAIGGTGCVVGIVGPPGIGKSRVVREVTAVAQSRGVEVFAAYCESHASEIPFYSVTSLLRAMLGVIGLGDEVARAKVRERIPDSDPQDLLLLDDLIGIRDTSVELPAINPDARRRRLTRLINTVSLARQTPALFVIEDVHWIDAVSESLLADFLTVIRQTPSLVLVTYRPEYHGALSSITDAQSIGLTPLSDSESTALITTLLGSDPSVRGLAITIAERAAGNPFFAQEMERDLAERGVLQGKRGAYLLLGAPDVAVPATLQSAIAARIDRLDRAAKRTLNAAAIIGMRFGADQLALLVGDAEIDRLTAAQLVDQVRFNEHPAYVFHHPLIRIVAYESQLTAQRADLHRRLAGAIKQRHPDTLDENAALIAEHFDAGGDLHAAFEWHMRAGNWLTNRDITGARMSWGRARQVADRLPVDDPHRVAMRIAPRSLLCATIWRVSGSLDGIGFDELRGLATAAGDKRSLVIGMSGLVQLMQFYGEYTEASRLASQHVELLESIGDRELTVGLLMVPMVVKWSVGEVNEAMELSQRAIDAAQGDPTMGNLILGSPLALALVIRASARCSLGIPGWREDFDSAVALARSTDKFTFCAVVMFKYIATQSRALLPGEDALRDTAEALEIAQQFGDDFTLTNAEFTRGLILVRRKGTDRKLGFELLDRARRAALDRRNLVVAAWCVDIDNAVENSRLGDYDGAIDLCRAALENEIRSGEMTNRGWCTSVLVEAMLNRGSDGDLDAARDAIDNLAATPVDPGFVLFEIPLLRLRALLARANGDELGYRDFAARYLKRATEVGYEGHVALAEAMT